MHVFSVGVKDRLRIGHPSRVNIGGVVIRTQNAQRICLGLDGSRETTPLSVRRGRKETGMGRGLERSKAEFESYNFQAR